MQIGIDSFAATTQASRSAPRIDCATWSSRSKHADRVGLDSFGVGEHHRRDYLDSAPAVILGAAAARTQRIRVVTDPDQISTELRQRSCMNA